MKRISNKCIFIMLLLFYFGICFFVLAGNNKKPFKISSNVFPLIVYAQHSEDAVSIARLGEDVLPEIIGILGIKEVPFEYAEILLTHGINDTFPWKVVFRTPTTKKTFLGARDQTDNRTLLIEGFIHIILASFMTETGEEDYNRILHIPRWVKDGILIKILYPKVQYYNFLQEVFEESPLPDFSLLIIDPDEFTYLLF